MASTYTSSYDEETELVYELGELLYSPRKKNCTFGEHLQANLPKTMMENPITNTRFKTLPTAWVRGATLSKVLFASCKTPEAD